jgi:competence protein ComEC
MISVVFAASLGILADRAASMMSIWGLVLFAAVSLALLAWLWVRQKHKRPWVWVLCAMVLSMGFYHRVEQWHYDRATIVTLVSDVKQPILLQAQVRGDIHRRPDLKPFPDRGQASSRGQGTDIGGEASIQTQGWKTTFIVDVHSVRIGSDWQPFTGGLQVTVEEDLSALGPGDRLQLGGDIASISGPSNPGESDFRSVARNRHVHARLSVDSARQVTLLEAGGPSVRRFADALARDGERTLLRLLSDDVSALACALVVGRRGSLDSGLKDQLLKTGTIHLLSVSGLHLGIVAGAVMTLGVMLGFGRRLQVLFIGLACVLFAAITGSQPPVMRAAILVATALLSLLVNRRPWPLSTLAFAGLVLLILEPTNLTQVGVQLSFVSVATLVCSSRSMEPAAHDIVADSIDTSSQIEALVDQTRTRRELWVRRQLRHVRDLAWLSFCVTLTTTPLTWFHFNLISPIAVLANLVLGLPTAVALISGLITIIGGWIWSPLAILPAYVCDLMLQLMLLIINHLSELPGGHAWLPSPPAWWVAVYYAALLGSFAVKRTVLKFKLSRHRAFVSGSLAWCVVAYFLAVSPSWQKLDALHATFVDVGHGTSVLVEMPEGEKYLYDCGRLGNYEGSSRGIEDVLWSRGLTRLDAVILSHADSDHYNSLPGVLERFAIDEVVIPPGLFNKPSPSLATLHQQIQAASIPIRVVCLDDKHVDVNQHLQILHPPRIRVSGSDNANSLVLRIDFAGTSLLLPGDLEPPGTELLVNQPRPRAGGVLMAPHHGSLTADSATIIDWSRPRVVIVSGGDRARRPEVAESLQTRGSDVLVTPISGAIRVIIDDQQTRVDQYLKQSW